MSKFKIFALLMFCVPATFAHAKSTLPTCPGSPATDYDLKLTWSGCYGEVTIGKAFFRAEYKNGERHGYCYFEELGRYRGDENLEKLYCGEKLFQKHRYNKNLCESRRTVKFEGECEYGKYSGYGERTLRDGTVLKGMFSGGFFQYAMAKPRSGEKTTSVSSGSTVSKQHKLKSAFVQLSSTDRRKIQSTLYDLGFYGSSIDGLYGRGTETALKEYNKEYLSAADLSRSYNVSSLLKDILTPQFEVEKVIANKPSKTFASWSDDTICKYVNEKGKDIHVAEAKERGLSCGVEEKQPMPEPEPTPKLDIAQVKASYDAKNFTKAFADAQVLAVQGDPEAQLLLGKMFADGRGTLQVSTVAHMWFNIASMGGIDEAYEERKTITAQMTPSAVEEAQKMAMKCIQSNYADCGLAVKPVAVKQPKPIQKTYITSGSQVELWYKDETPLKRKQLHYALKKLGVYNSSVDGIWGGNTSRAFTRYINKYKRDAESVDEIFASILSKVKVPSTFSTPKKSYSSSSPSSNNAGLTAIISNPSMSGKQALAICEPMARLAASDAASRAKNTVKCSSRTDYAGNVKTKCRETDNNGFPGIIPLLLETDPASQAKRESKRVYTAKINSCLAQYGWQTK